MKTIELEDLTILLLLFIDKLRNDLLFLFFSVDNFLRSLVLKCFIVWMLALLALELALKNLQIYLYVLVLVSFLLPCLPLWTSNYLIVLCPLLRSCCMLYNVDIAWKFLFVHSGCWRQILGWNLMFGILEMIYLSLPFCVSCWHWISHLIPFWNKVLV